METLSHEVVSRTEQQAMLDSPPAPSLSGCDCDHNRLITGSNGGTEGKQAVKESEDEDDISAILRRAGVELDIDSVQGEGTVSLNLLSEFASCCVRNEYRAADILCHMILELEADNVIALQFRPLLQERLRLDELPLESSSEDDTSNKSSSSSSSESSSSSSSEDTVSSHLTSSTPPQHT